MRDIPHLSPLLNEVRHSIANHIRLQPHRHGLVPGPYVVSRPSQRLLRTFTRVRARQHPVLHPETRSATTDFYIRQRTEINTHSRLLVHLRQYDLYLSLAIQTINLSRSLQNPNLWTHLIVTNFRKITILTWHFRIWFWFSHLQMSFLKFLTGRWEIPFWNGSFLIAK